VGGGGLGGGSFLPSETHKFYFHKTATTLTFDSIYLVISRIFIVTVDLMIVKPSLRNFWKTSTN
jgi:hypothetical protein